MLLRLCLGPLLGCCAITSQQKQIKEKKIHLDLCSIGAQFNMAEKLCQQEGKAPCLTQRLTFPLRKERVHSCRDYGASRHGLKDPLPPSRPHFLKVQPSPHKAPPLKECIVHRRHFVFRSQRVASECTLQMASPSITLTYEHRDTIWGV